MKTKPMTVQSNNDKLIAEGLMTLSEAARKVGIQVSDRALLQWCAIGARGRQLESVLVGGRRRTSQQALRRFLDSLNAEG